MKKSSNPEASAFRNVNIEISLKPFYDLSPETVRQTCDHLFEQWLPLLDTAKTVSVMLWTSDGSELLDYNRDMDTTFEWAYFIGSANPHTDAKDDSIASKPVLYRDNPPTFHYRDLQRIVTTLKSRGQAITGKPVSVGTTFDPGPEFARSSFKYERHPEICTGNPSAGVGCGKLFIYCAEHLKADTRPYAGYPKGIPEGTPFGRFLGRQATCFCADLGFDFLWLSNGIGFGKDTWGIIGSTFDAKTFSPENGEAVRQGMLEFWREFRRECPAIQVFTRGTNSTSSVDIATDAVPLREIYDEVANMEVPPNSPWAPINGDVGMELAGWMSHIAELPKGKSYLYRFYINDPWWAFSPWLHQYQRQPYDICLSLAITRLDDQGRPCRPENLSILTADDSYGEMPPSIPREVTPALLSASATLPDAAGPLIWLYPFDEYHDLAFNQHRQEEVFFGDMYMRDAINLGFPVNTVVSTTNFVQAQTERGIDTSNVIVTPTAAAETPAVLAALEDFLAAGGGVILYGPLHSPALMELLGQESCPALEGEVTLERNGQQLPVRHTALLSGGPLNTRTLDKPGVTEMAGYAQGPHKRAAAVQTQRPEWGPGKLIWLRGTNSFTIAPSGFNTIMLDAQSYYYPEDLLRDILKSFGWSIDFIKPVNARQTEPHLNFRRHANALYLAAHCPDTTVGIKLRTPDGAPVFCSTDTILTDGAAHYQPGQAANWEGRLFVTQGTGLIQCAEQPLKSTKIKRKLLVSGLEEATLRFYPEPGFERTTCFTRIDDDTSLTPLTKGTLLELQNLSGPLIIAW